MLVVSFFQEVSKNLWPAATINVKHHLEKLVKDKKVEMKNGLWYLKSD